MLARPTADLGRTLTEVFYGNFEQHFLIYGERGSHRSIPVETATFASLEVMFTRAGEYVFPKTR